MKWTYKGIHVIAYWCLIVKVDHPLIIIINTLTAAHSDISSHLSISLSKNHNYKQLQHTYQLVSQRITKELFAMVEEDTTIHSQSCDEAAMT